MNAEKTPLQPYLKKDYQKIWAAARWRTLISLAKLAPDRSQSKLLNRNSGIFEKIMKKVHRCDRGKWATTAFRKSAFFNFIPASNKQKQYILQYNITSTKQQARTMLRYFRTLHFHPFLMKLAVHHTTIYLFICIYMYIVHTLKKRFKCMSMIQPGRIRQEVTILKSPTWLKLGRMIACDEHIHVLKHQVKIFHFTRVMGSYLVYRTQMT